MLNRAHCECTVDVGQQLDLYIWAFATSFGEFWQKLGWQNMPILGHFWVTFGLGLGQNRR